MADNEVLMICNHLKNNSITLSPDNPWLIGCIEWYKSQNDVVNVQLLLEYVCNQWLLADLHDIQEACLPTVNNQDVFRKLTGKYAVQVNWIRDVGQSSYSQLKNLQVSSETQSNETFTVDKPEKWEPRPTRMYMLEITDGVSTLHAMEYARISKLEEPFFPGTKILISGPLECRRGVLLLQENNVTILGGEVFSLLISNSTENILARSLNIEEQLVDQPIQNGVNQGNIPTRVQHFSSSSRSMTYRDTTPIPHSNNVNENFVTKTAESVDILASDEDDELLLQINSDVLQPDELSRIGIKPIVNAVNNSSNYRFSKEPNNHNFKRSDGKYSNDNQPVTQTSINQSVVPSDSQINRLKSVRSDCDEIPTYPNTKFNCLNVEEKNTFRGAISASKIHNWSSSSLQPSGSGLQSKSSTYSSEHDLTFDDDEDIIFASLEEEPQFPYCKQIQGRVQSLSSKLKIRDGEWTITAMITDGKTSFDVEFSSEVLEEIFGFSAAEVQSKRGEMAINPAIKEKVNTMLKDGQKKLKSMKCTMTVEFPSASESPKVVAVD